MFRFSRLMASMEAGHYAYACRSWPTGVESWSGPSHGATLTILRRAPWYQCVTRGLLWEREWLGAIA
jgi:hypothetical protein